MNRLYTPMKVSSSCDTLSLSDVTDKQTSWLVNVTFDWRQVMTSAVQLYGRTCCLITFLRRVFCSANTESSQLIRRSDLKIKCLYKSFFFFFYVHRVMKPVVVTKILQEAPRASWNFSFLTRWTSKNQILILKSGDVIKHLSRKVKTLETSQQLRQDSKFNTISYLPCPSKLVWGIKSDFQNLWCPYFFGRNIPRTCH